MSAQVFIDGGWIGLNTGSPSLHTTTSLSVEDALRLAADLVEAAVDDAITSRLCGRETPLYEALRFAADRLIEPTMLPKTANGTSFEWVG